MLEHGPCVGSVTTMIVGLMIIIWALHIVRSASGSIVSMRNNLRTNITIYRHAECSEVY